MDQIKSLLMFILFIIVSLVALRIFVIFVDFIFDPSMGIFGIIFGIIVLIFIYNLFNQN